MPRRSPWRPRRGIGRRRRNSIDTARDYDTEDEADEDFTDDEEDRGGRAPLLIGLAIVALVVVGIGAYAYAERDTIMSFLSFGGGDEVAATDTAAARS